MRALAVVETVIVLGGCQVEVRTVPVEPVPPSGDHSTSGDAPGDTPGDSSVGDRLGDPLPGDPSGDPLSGDPLGDPLAGDPSGDPLPGDPHGDPTGDSAPVLVQRYLSDLAWTSADNGWGPVERDTSNGEDVGGDGDTLTIDGITYLKGLGVHSHSDVRFALDGKCTSFSAEVGVDDECSIYGSVVFVVWTDDTERARTGTTTFADPATPLSIDVSGATELRLEVTDAGDDGNCDHADWADAWVRCYL